MGKKSADYSGICNKWVLDTDGSDMATYDGAHGKLSDRSQKYHKRKLSNLQRDSKSGTA